MCWCEYHCIHFDFVFFIFIYHIAEKHEHKKTTLTYIVILNRFSSIMLQSLVYVPQTKFWGEGWVGDEETKSYRVHLMVASHEEFLMYSVDHRSVRVVQNAMLVSSILLSCVPHVTVKSCRVSWMAAVTGVYFSMLFPACGVISE